MAINIDINSRSLVEMQNRLRQINSELENISDADAINQLTTEAEQLNQQLNGTTTATKNLKTQLREITVELQGLEPGTARFNELSIAAGQLRDTIQDTNAVINATAGSAVENLGTGLTGVAGVGIAAFQGLASAQALFGTESEALQKTLVRLQALAGLSDAVKSLGGLKDTVTTVKASFIALTTQLGIFTTAEATATTATVAQTTATEGATVAQSALNTTMLANPIFLVIAAIAALTAAYFYFSDSAEDATKANDKLITSLENNADVIERANAKITKSQENRIALLKANGANEKQILEEEVILIKQRDAARKASIDEEKQAIIDLGKVRKQAYADEDFEEADRLTKEINNRYKKIKDLKDLDGQAKVDEKILRDTFNQKQQEAEDKQNQTLLDKRKKYYDELKKLQLQAKQNEYKEQQDFLNSLDQLIEQNYSKTLTDQQREEQTVNDKYFNLETKAANNAEQLAIIEEAKLNELNEIRLKYAKIEQDAKDKLEADNEIAKQKNIDRLAQEEKDREDSAKKEIELAKKVQNAKLQAVSDTFSTIQSITELFANGNEKQQKRAFEINKAASIAKATIDTFTAANGAYSALASIPVVGPVLGAVAAGAAVAAGVANIKKIADTKFESKSAPSTGGNVGGNAASNQSSNVTNASPTFTLSGQGNKSNSNIDTNTKESNQAINVSVSVEEITNTQNRVAKLKDLGSL